MFLLLNFEHMNTTVLRYYVRQRKDHFTAILLSLMYICVTGTAPVYLSEKSKSSPGSDTITRSNEELVVPTPKTWRYSGSLLLTRDIEFEMVSVRRDGNIDNYKNMTKPLKHSHYLIF